MIDLERRLDDRVKLAAYRTDTARDWPLPPSLLEPRHAIRQAVLDYRPPPFDGRLLLVRCAEPRAFGLPDEAMGWRDRVTSPAALEVVVIAHSHSELLSAQTAPQPVPTPPPTDPGKILPAVPVPVEARAVPAVASPTPPQEARPLNGTAAPAPADRDEYDPADFNRRTPPPRGSAERCSRSSASPSSSAA